MIYAIGNEELYRSFRVCLCHLTLSGQLLCHQQIMSLISMCTCDIDILSGGMLIMNFTFDNLKHSKLFDQ